VAINIVAVALFGTFARGSFGDSNKRVQIVGGGVELIELSASAPKCGKQKGETIRLRVTSETVIDVRMYVQIGWHQWISKDFANQKKGDEISEFRCDQKPNYKIYSHAAGSTEAWPRP
jgi:hypothetical protein